MSGNDRNTDKLDGRVENKKCHPAIPGLTRHPRADTGVPPRSITRPPLLAQLVNIFMSVDFLSMFVMYVALSITTIVQDCPKLLRYLHTGRTSPLGGKTRGFYITDGYCLGSRVNILTPNEPGKGHGVK